MKKFLKLLGVTGLLAGLVAIAGCGGGGGGGDSTPSPRKDLSVSGAGTDSVANGDYNVAIAAGAYTHTVSDFATGDKLVLPTGYTVSSVDNTGSGNGSDAFTDKKVILELKSASDIIYITLTGLTDEQDKALNFPTDMTTVFGAGSVTK